MNRNVSFCSNCNKEVAPSISLKEEEALIKGEKVIYQKEYRLCSSCHQELDSKDLKRKNMIACSDVYKARHSLLTASEIVGIRKGLGLSGTKFGLLLGLGEKTITRFENGDIQSKEIDNLIRLAKLPGNVRLLKKWSH